MFRGIFVVDVVFFSLGGIFIHSSIRTKIYTRTVCELKYAYKQMSVYDYYHHHRFISPVRFFWFDLILLSCFRLIHVNFQNRIIVTIVIIVHKGETSLEVIREIMELLLMLVLLLSSLNQE